MENRIIKDFQDLRVLAAYDLAIMDDLVRDFTLALDESRMQRSCRDAPSFHSSLARRRRRFKKRKADLCMLLHGTSMRSEASESSLDEAFKDYIENIVRQSDSDDFVVNGNGGHKRIPAALNFPMALTTSIVPQLVESDSVTENATPLRPQRRRKHFKRMSIDLQSNTNFGKRLKDSAAVCESGRLVEGMVAMDTGLSCSTHALSGKRKRCAKDKSDSNSFDLDLNDENQLENRIRGLEKHFMDGNLSSLSSNDSDCGNSTGDGRDGDDEESDAYHESEGNGGGGGSNAGNGSEHVNDKDLEKMQVMDADMEKMFATSLELMSPASRSCFKARMKAMSGRQIQAGRRRLKDRHPGYSLSSFLQERQMWCLGGTGLCPGNVAMVSGGASKRHRRMPPTEATFEMLPEPSDSGPNCNFGGRLLPSQLLTFSAQKPSRLKAHGFPSASHHFIS